MIAFGCSIAAPPVFERYARVGIERVAEPDSPVLANAAAGPVARSYNLMLDTAAAVEGLDALVLVHEDAEIVDPDCCAKLRTAFEDPAVAIVGCVGAQDVQGLAWWDGTVRWNSAPIRYPELGGGHLTPRPLNPAPQSPGDVDSLYGVMLAFSPWAVRNLRFEESLAIRHGYDFDICRKARIADRKVVAVDISVVHHHTLDLFGDNENEVWIAAHMRAAELWDNDASADHEGWRPRARRAEAQAAAARLLAASKLLQADATVQMHAREIEGLLASRSWRFTKPLRRAKTLLKTTRSLGSLGKRTKHLVP
jgi:GT2 family glycosyltransferase